MDTEVLTESVDRHPLVSLVAACFWVIRAFSDVQYHLNVNRDVENLVWLLSWTKSLVAFATITIPRFIYAVLSYSMTLTVRRHSYLLSIIHLDVLCFSLAFGTSLFCFHAQLLL
jgi:hypothetical protein